jgi:hypothetical protein
MRAGRHDEHRLADELVIHEDWHSKHRERRLRAGITRPEPLGELGLDRELRWRADCLLERCHVHAIRRRDDGESELAILTPESALRARDRRAVLG